MRQREVKGHVTHIVDPSPTIEAIAHVASAAGAVPLTLTQVLTVSKLTAAAIVLCTHTHTQTHSYR